jgi:hypothetical protein
MHLFIARFPQLLGDVQASADAVDALAVANATTGMLLGITALRCFTQHNFTGPSISGDLESDLQVSPFYCDFTAQSTNLRMLTGLRQRA